MQRKFKSLAEALSAPPVAANDNAPQTRRSRKVAEPRYRGSLPTLRWLYDNHPDLAEPVAEAVQALAVSNWDADAVDSDQEIRPTVGELMRAATDPDTGEHLKQTVERDADGNVYIRIGSLRFRDGVLVEYGRTKRGRKLQPRDRIVSRDEDFTEKRNPASYIALRGAVASPLHAGPYQRPMSGDPALAPMYAPLDGVESNRAELKRLGVDGGVQFDSLPGNPTKGRAAIAAGAEFLGGVVGMSGTSSNGAIAHAQAEKPRGEVMRIVDEIAAGATLKEIGERMGLVGARVDRGAKDFVLDAARTLAASNDNLRKKNAA